jgi:hypothetical protein
MDARVLTPANPMLTEGERSEESHSRSQQRDTCCSGRAAEALIVQAPDLIDGADV